MVVAVGICYEEEIEIRTGEWKWNQPPRAVQRICRNPTPQTGKEKRFFPTARTPEPSRNHEQIKRQHHYFFNPFSNNLFV
jgi:hypothetical protein